MHSRDERLALNEALFRAANELIADTAEEWDVAGPEGEPEFFCECANRDCTLRVRLTVDEYQRIRRDSTLFFIRPGHEVEEIERVVEAPGDYLVVRKVGVGAEIAAETDPAD